MSKSVERRLTRLEQAMVPPATPYEVVMIAADDPEAERLMREHEEWRPGRPAPTLIILTDVHRGSNGIMQ